MTVWLLWYCDDGDYYTHYHDLLGAYSTLGKAEFAAKKECKSRDFCSMDVEATRHLEIEAHEVL